MYKHFIVLLVVLSSTHLIKAQVYPSGGQGGCAIIYEYDAAGNRIKRSKICWSPNGGGGGSLRPIATSKDASLLDMVIYPNPTSSYITIDFSSDVFNAKVELQDVAGRVLATSVPKDRSVQFDLQSYAQGTYLVVLKRKDTKELLVRKIIKE
jgi:hypothetical protein